MEKGILKKFETFEGKEEEHIRYAWSSFTVHIDKQRGLWYAYNAKLFLDGWHLPAATAPDYVEQAYKKGLGYHVVAMLYLWNNWFDEAFEIDGHFLSPLYQEYFKEGIEQYIEMLLVKRQGARLLQLFDAAVFKAAFLPHYEVYQSLLVSVEYPVTNMQAFVPLVNKVNKLCTGYGEPRFIG
jgi:hypothetical protein